MSIYKIKCLTTNDFYIGSTNNFTRRKYQHRSHFRCNVKNSCDKLYDFMRLNGGLDNFDFSILEEFKNIIKKELKIIEQKYIDELKPTLNAIKSYATEEDIRLMYCKGSSKYRIKHPDKIKAYGKEYQQRRYDCECGKNVQLCKKSRHEKTAYHISNIA